MRELDETRVQDRMASTNADRARFLGLAFTITFFLAALGDLAGMGTLQHHAFMACQLLLSAAVVVIVRFTAFGRDHAATVFAAGMSAVSAAGAAHLSQFGGLDGPWFYGSYTAPPVMIPMLFSLRARIGWTFTTVAGFVGVYRAGVPDLFDHPMGHVPLVYLATISGISIALGHYVHRLEVGSFIDVVRLNDAAAVLEAQLKAGEQQPSELRRRLARQLHDDVAQLITGARLQLDGWSRSGPRHHGKDDAARRLAELLDELAQRSRRMLDELRAPPPVGPLVEALERLRGSYLEHGLVIDTLIEDEAPGLGEEQARTDAVVACVREALTNAVRHARATEATVSLHLDDAQITVSVLDNGGGRSAGLREGNGLRGMRERLAEQQGHLDVSDYDAGLRLTFSLPRRSRP